MNAEGRVDVRTDTHLAVTSAKGSQRLFEDEPSLYSQIRLSSPTHIAGSADPPVATSMSGSEEDLFDGSGSQPSRSVNLPVPRYVPPHRRLTLTGKR